MAFKTGTSGCPQGRPKGIQDRRTVFREMVEPKASALIDKAVNMALDGNEQMLKLLLDRILPAKPREETISASILGSTLKEQGENIYKALSSGEINLAEAKTLLETTVVQAKILEYHRHEQKEAAWGIF